MWHRSLSLLFFCFSQKTAYELLISDCSSDVCSSELLWCRIRLRQLRYQGPATAPATDESLIYPSIGGGMNWGGVSVDPERGLMKIGRASCRERVCQYV